jgi:hypothetical protein
MKNQKGVARIRKEAGRSSHDPESKQAEVAMGPEKYQAITARIRKGTGMSSQEQKGSRQEQPGPESNRQK